MERFSIAGRICFPSPVSSCLLINKGLAASRAKKSREKWKQTMKSKAGVTFLLAKKKTPDIFLVIRLLRYGSLVRGASLR